MLKNLIKENMGKMSIEELANETGIDKGNVNTLVNIKDLARIPVEQLIFVARALDVEIDELYKEYTYSVEILIRRYRHGIWETLSDDFDACLFISPDYNECKDFIYHDFNYDKYKEDAKNSREFVVTYSINLAEVNEAGNLEPDDEICAEYTYDIIDKMKTESIVSDLEYLQQEIYISDDFIDEENYIENIVEDIPEHDGYTYLKENNEFDLSSLEDMTKDEKVTALKNLYKEIETITRKLEDDIKKGYRLSTYDIENII